jgi:ribosome biogenesis GTPase
VLLGSSGAGKSTLVNALAGEERQAIAPVRAGDDRGRHTTTRRELIVLRSGALLIDTPGLRLPRVWDEVEGVAEVFADVDELARDCRFADCAHAGEPGCAVAAAIEAGVLPAERLAHRRKLERERAAVALRHDEAARRRAGRDSARAYRKVRGRSER